MKQESNRGPHTPPQQTDPETPVSSPIPTVRAPTPNDAEVNVSVGPAYRTASAPEFKSPLKMEMKSVIIYGRQQKQQNLPHKTQPQTPPGTTRLPLFAGVTDFVLTLHRAEASLVIPSSTAASVSFQRTPPPLLLAGGKK